MYQMKRDREKQRKRDRKKDNGKMSRTLTEKQMQEDKADLRKLAKSFTTSPRVTDRGYVVSRDMDWRAVQWIGTLRLCALYALMRMRDIFSNIRHKQGLSMCRQIASSEF